MQLGKLIENDYWIVSNRYDSWSLGNGFAQNVVVFMVNFYCSFRKS